MNKVFTLVAGLAVALQASALSVAGVEVPAPWPAGNTVDTYFGVEVPDPYRALENTKDPAVQAWMRGQADATEAILARLPGRAPMLARMREIDDATSGQLARVIRTANGRLFVMRRNPGDEQFHIVWRESAEAVEHTLVDAGALSRAAGGAVAVMEFQPSPDGKMLAYSTQQGGSELGTLHVVDVATGRTLMSPLDGVRYPQVSWRRDASGFFYTRLRPDYAALPAAQRQLNRQRRFRNVQDPVSDRLVLSAESAPELRLPAFTDPGVFEIAGTTLAGAWIGHGVDRTGQFLVAEMADVLKGQPRWRRVIGRDDEVTDVSLAAGTLYFMTTRGAPRGRVMRLPLDAADLSQAQTLVPQTAGVIVDMAAARDALYLTRREGVNLVLYRVPHGAAAADVQSVVLPAVGRVGIRFADAAQDGVLLTVAGWTFSPRHLAWNPEAARALPLALVRAGNVAAPPGLQVRDVSVPGHDGTPIPLTVLSRQGLELDGNNPTIIFGYGAYGIPNDPSFTPHLLAWLERGGVYAVAHVRGGGAFGRDWHLAGQKATKANTWKDTISIAEWLIKERYTRPQKLGLYGGSAGGILVSRALIERPELFAAAVPAVGVLDALRAERMPGGEANIPEFGSVRVEADFKPLLAMSSYHQLREGQRLPAVMLVHGVNDGRVEVWQSAKFASRLAALKSTEQPVLLRLEYDAGHGQGSARSQEQQRMADLFSFFLWRFGTADFQPLPAP